MDFPLINACLNMLSTVFLVLGYIAVKKKKIEIHKKFMVTALCTSALFLTSYLYYHFTSGHFKFTGEGVIRTVYFIILVPHILLAAGMVPMILRTFYLAFKGEEEKHRKIAKVTLPIWLYVSFTGVILYLYIYVWFPGNLIKEDPNQPATVEQVQ